ncbi:hypothetical protein [Pikeienuella piscinae]|nr:hypothetical protein [Pikeienuella piscinae]
MLSPALPVKDALRSLRTGLAAGREVIRPLRSLVPPPVGGLVDDFMHRIDRIGLRVEHETSRAVHSMLDHSTPQERNTWTLARMATDPAGPTAFAERLYFGLEIAFERLSLPSELLSEMLAARAFDRTLRSTPPPGDSFDLAAALLIEADAGMFAPPPPFAVRASAADRRLALFAVMLWLLVDPDDDPDEQALLDICIDAAAALGRQIAELPDDRAAIRRLLSEYARLI